MLNMVYLLIGIALLTVGGELLIRGSLGVAKRAGISPLLCGLVIVGFGTSMPELVVSLDAALSGQPDIAIGNVVGSNIANILLILGLCALITPMAVSAISLRRDAIVVVAAGVAFLLLSYNGYFTGVEGMLFIVALTGYLFWAYLTEKNSSLPSGQVHEAEAAEVTVIPKSMVLSCIEIVAGLAILIFGSQVLLKGAVGIAVHLGVSEAMIALTLVAVGTSLPELTISVIAALRKHADVAVGNVLGSNIFNLLGILGVSSMVQPMEIKNRVAEFDQWMMVAVSILLYVFLYTGRKLGRIEGGCLLLGYIGYVAVSFLYFSS